MQAPKPKDVLPLAQEITRLETQLADAKRRWNLLFGIEQAERKPRASSVDGITARIATFIVTHPDQDHTISSVAAALSEPELQVGRTLYRLAQTGKIENPSRGKYRAQIQPVGSKEEVLNF
jgi:hypothetical protein